MEGRCKGEVIYVYLWLIHVEVWQKTTKFCKAIILQLKKLIIKKLVFNILIYIFIYFKITADGDCSYEIKRCFLLGRKVMTNLDSILKSRDITLPTKVHLVKAMTFPVMYRCELYYKESWAPKKWCFWTVVLEKTLEIPLDCKEIWPVHPKGNPYWIFIGRTDAEAETSILWPPDVKSWLIWKDLDAGKNWRWEKKGMAENEMVGWHHQLNGHEFE